MFHGNSCGNRKLTKPTILLNKIKRVKTPTYQTVEHPPSNPLQNIPITEVTGFLSNQPDMITHRVNYQVSRIIVKDTRSVTATNF